MPAHDAGALHELATLTTDVATATDLPGLAASALPRLRSLAAADAVVLLRRVPGGVEQVAGAGRPLPPALPDAAAGDPVPTAWGELGVERVRSHPVADSGDMLVLAWYRTTDDAADPVTTTATAVVLNGLVRLAAEGALSDLQRRVDSAQLLANMGDYDWHIATDSNRWSDQLYRIYGHDPQSFHPSYDRFLSMIHEDDRTAIRAVHERAYATGESFTMTERVVRPDGSVRYLLSNGEVVLDEEGRPVRMRGTCIDVTDQHHAEVEREEAAVRLAEVQERRRQAFELNDNVVQGLSSARYALDQQLVPDAESILDRTLEAARAMMDRLLDSSGPGSGDLTRTVATALEGVARPALAPVPDVPDEPDLVRVLLVDDADDIRMLLQAQIRRTAGYTVVGEAADGVEAVEQARSLQPDLVLLDLAMPRMDGLQALPLIREAAPAARVIALSGFNERTMEERAMSAGADRYVVKGGRFRELLEEMTVTMRSA